MCALRRSPGHYFCVPPLCVIRGRDEHSSSIGWSGLYSSFFGGSHPSSWVMRRLGLPISFQASENAPVLIRHEHVEIHQRTID